jgi:hypothetical protein
MGEAEVIVERFVSRTGHAAGRPHDDDHRVYFVIRLFEALCKAEQAECAEERAVHLRASRYYHELIELSSMRRTS